MLDEVCRNLCQIPLRVPVSLRPKKVVFLLERGSTHCSNISLKYLLRSVYDECLLLVKFGAPFFFASTRDTIHFATGDPELLFTMTVTMTRTQ